MIRAATLALFMRVLGTGIWLLYTVAMARILSQSEFGTVMYAINLALILAPVATLGFETSTLKHASNYWQKGAFAAFSGMLSQARRMTLWGGGIFIAAMIAANISGVRSPVSGDLFIAGLTGVSIAAAAMMGIHRDTLRAADKLVWAFLGFSILRTLLPLLLSLGLYAMGILDVVSALLAFTAALFVSLFTEFWVLGRLNLPKAELNPEQITAHWAVARGTWLGDMAHVVLMRSPAVCMGLILDLRFLALFLAAERISNLGQFLTDAVRTAAAPELARACDTQAEMSVRRAGISQVSKLMLKSGVADALLLAAIGWPVLYLMGPEFTVAYPLILAAILVQIGWTIPGPTAMIMNMAGLERQRTLWTCLAALILVVCLFTLVPTGQPIAALYIQAIVVWGLNIWQVLQIKRKLAVWSGLLAIWGKS